MIYCMRILEKIVLIMFLLYAIFIIIDCPCNVVLSCHKSKFLFFVAIPIMYVLFL